MRAYGWCMGGIIIFIVAIAFGFMFPWTLLISVPMLIAAAMSKPRY